MLKNLNKFLNESRQKNNYLEVLFLSVFIFVPLLLNKINQNVENFSDLFDCIDIKNTFLNKNIEIEGLYNLNFIKEKPIWVKSNNLCFISQVETDSKDGLNKLWLLQGNSRNGTTLFLYNTSTEKNPPFSDWKSPQHENIPSKYNIKPVKDFFEFSNNDYSKITITNCYKSACISKKQIIIAIATFMILLGALVGLYIYNKNNYNI